jgi:hypothetical protein
VFGHAEQSQQPGFLNRLREHTGKVVMILDSKAALRALKRSGNESQPAWCGSQQPRALQPRRASQPPRDAAQVRPYRHAEHAS